MINPASSSPHMGPTGQHGTHVEDFGTSPNSKNTRSQSSPDVLRQQTALFAAAAKAQKSPPFTMAQNPITGARQLAALSNHRDVPGGRMADVSFLAGGPADRLVAIKYDESAKWTLMPRDIKAAMDPNSPPPSPPQEQAPAQAGAQAPDPAITRQDAEAAARGEAAHALANTAGTARINEQVNELIEIMRTMVIDQQTDGQELRDNINAQQLIAQGMNPGNAGIQNQLNDINALLQLSNNQLNTVVQAWLAVENNPPPATDPNSPPT